MFRIYGLIIIFFIIFSCGIKNNDIDPELSKTHLMTNKDFQKQYDFKSILKFVRSYPKNIMTEEQVQIIVNAGKEMNVSQLLILFIMQFESGLLVNTDGNYRYKWRENRCMGTSLQKSYVNKDGNRIYVDAGFSNQVMMGAMVLKNHFDSYVAGKTIVLQKYKNKIIPDNGATWALYKYRPFFESHEIYNWSIKPIGIVAGNDVYIKYFYKYKNKIRRQK